MNKLKNSENETAIEFVHIVFSAIINIRTNKFLREILCCVSLSVGDIQLTLYTLRTQNAS